MSKKIKNDDGEEDLNLNECQYCGNKGIEVELHDFTNEEEKEEELPFCGDGCLGAYCRKSGIPTAEFPLMDDDISS